MASQRSTATARRLATAHLAARSLVAVPVAGHPGELAIPAIGATIALDAITAELERAGARDHTAIVARFVDGALEACTELAELRLAHWPQVRDRLLARVVPIGRGGLLAWPVPGAAGLVFDVGLAVGPAAAPVTPSLLVAWGRPPGGVRSTAVAASARRQLRATVARIGPVTVTVLTGDRWTTGILADPGPATEGLPLPPLDRPRWFAAVDAGTVLGIGGTCDAEQARVVALGWFASNPGPYPPNLVDARAVARGGDSGH